MSWITVLWSMAASASLTFALLHLLIWARGVQPWANLSFSIAATASAAITFIELMTIRTTSIEEMALLLRWVHLPLLVLWVAIICFIRVYYDVGRSWLAWTAGLLRLLALTLSLTTGENLYFDKITSLNQIAFWGGETISIPMGSLNPWYAVGPISALALALFVLDAAVTLWRKGTRRRRAIIFSGSVIFYLLTAVGHTAMVNAGLIESPYITSLSFLPILFAMAYELSCKLLDSMGLAKHLQTSEAGLRTSEQRMSLAASAAELRLWEWDIIHDEIWSTDKGQMLVGFNASEKISFERYLSVVHVDDRERVRHLVEKALQEKTVFESEYRIVLPDCQIKWISARGRIEFDNNNKPLQMHGVSIDITQRKQTELEMRQQRNELVHLSRVTMLGELSGSLAHELNQPLAAILSNAQAAQRFLARDDVDLAEIKDILNDIVAENRRAGEIIHRLRQLLKKCEIERLPVDLNKLVSDVLILLRSDLLSHKIVFTVSLDQNLPTIIGDRVQIQQMLLNLIMNACEAMSENDSDNHNLRIRTALNDDNYVQISIEDQGPGIPVDAMESIFKPFFTTKRKGLGLGLAICRTIVTAHGGQLWASNNVTSSGANFQVTLPAYKADSQ
jgi:two-component system, LuxR family, sensor kinase FixL